MVTKETALRLCVVSVWAACGFGHDSWISRMSVEEREWESSWSDRFLWGPKRPTFGGCFLILKIHFFFSFFFLYVRIRRTADDVVLVWCWLTELLKETRLVTLSHTVPFLNFNFFLILEINYLTNYHVLFYFRISLYKIFNIFKFKNDFSFSFCLLI